MTRGRSLLTFFFSILCTFSISLAFAAEENTHAVSALRGRRLQSNPAQQNVVWEICFSNAGAYVAGFEFFSRGQDCPHLMGKTYPILQASGTLCFDMSLCGFVPNPISAVVGVRLEPLGADETIPFYESLQYDFATPTRQQYQFEGALYTWSYREIETDEPATRSSDSKGGSQVCFDNEAWIIAKFKSIGAGFTSQETKVALGAPLHCVNLFDCTGGRTGHGCRIEISSVGSAYDTPRDLIVYYDPDKGDLLYRLDGVIYSWQVTLVDEDV